MQQVDAQLADARGAGTQESREAREQVLERGLQHGHGFRCGGQFEPLVEALRHEVAPAWRRAAAEPLVELVEQLRPEAGGKARARQPEQVRDARDAEPGERRDRILGPLQAGERQPRCDARHRIGAGHRHREPGAREPERAACRRRYAERSRQAARREARERAPQQGHDAAEEIEAAAHLGEHGARRLEAHDRRELQCPAPEAVEQRGFRRGPPFQDAQPRHQGERRIQSHAGRDALACRALVAGDDGAARIVRRGDHGRARLPGAQHQRIERQAGKVRGEPELARRGDRLRARRRHRHQMRADDWPLPARSGPDVPGTSPVPGFSVCAGARCARGRIGSSAPRRRGRSHGP